MVGFLSCGTVAYLGTNKENILCAREMDSSSVSNLISFCSNHYRENKIGHIYTEVILEASTI